MKTRFDLILDRSVQFITNAGIDICRCGSDSCYVVLYIYFFIEPSTQQLSEDEIKLIEVIIKLTINGQTRCQSIIPWSLSPSKPRDFKLFVVDSLLKAKSVNLDCDLKMARKSDKFYKFL